MLKYNSNSQLKFNPNTPLKFYAKETGYIPGQGNTTIWQQIIVDSLYCEWRGRFGDRALSAQALGVKDSANIRTFFHPIVYNKLKTVQVVIAKNGTNILINGVPDKNNPDCYELWGGVDNVKEENKYLEFRVRRYEGL
jgi:hypothetical protein